MVVLGTRGQGGVEHQVQTEHTNLDSALGDHGTVGLVDNVVNQLEVERIGDDLVIGDDVLLRLRRQYN